MHYYNKMLLCSCREHGLGRLCLGKLLPFPSEPVKQPGVGLGNQTTASIANKNHEVWPRLFQFYSLPFTVTPFGEPIRIPGHLPHLSRACPWAGTERKEAFFIVLDAPVPLGVSPFAQ